MDKLRLLVAALLITSCGPDVPYIVRSPKLHELVEDYRALLDINRIDTKNFGYVFSVEYGPTDDDVLGYCELRAPFGPRAGYINRVFIRPGLSAPMKRAIVYHELTHCIFIMEHIEGRPHLMNAYLPSERMVEGQWDSLVTSLIASIHRREGFRHP